MLGIFCRSGVVIEETKYVVLAVVLHYFCLPWECSEKKAVKINLWREGIATLSSLLPTVAFPSNPLGTWQPTQSM